MDVSSLRGIPVLDSRSQLTQESDLVVSVVDVPIINVSKVSCMRGCRSEVP